MSEWKKSVFPAIGVVATIVAFLGGNEIRTRQDTGLATRKVPQSYLAGLDSASPNPVNVPEGEMFYQLLLLLERDYVDPNIDEQKLAYGAVKGMIDGLWDPLSRFYQKDQFEEHERRLRGVFGGAGLEIRQLADKTELSKVQRGARPTDPLLLRPIMVVASVLPGGPADKAGLKVGDQVMGVNDKWALGYTEVATFRQLQKDLVAGKVTSSQFNAQRAVFQRRAKTSVSTGRLEEILTNGEGKLLNVTWSRQGKEMTASLTTKSTTVPRFEKRDDGSYALNLFKGASQDLKDLQPVDGVVTLDLRQSTVGDPTEIKPVLEKLVPAGDYGQIVTQKSGEPKSIVTTSGTQESRRYRLLVDTSTRGAAEIIALSLKARGLAELVGGPTANEPVWIETVALADGSGYSLNVGRFAANSLEARK